MTVEKHSTTKKLHSTPRKPATVLAPEVLRQLPAKYWNKAGKAFEKFSLSRFTQDSRPATYVPRLKENDPQAVHDVQRELITQRIKALPNADALTPGMTLALTPAEMEKLLPSFDKDAGTIELSELLALLGQKMKGTEFYANGNPTLNRLALQSKYRAQARAIIDAIQQGPCTPKKKQRVSQ
jgi:hypothetical protein